MNDKSINNCFDLLGEYEMSGGDLCDYCQYALVNVVEDLEEKIELGEYTEDIKILLLLVIADLQKNAIVLQRIDWLVSGDDGKEAFYRRLTEELRNGK